MVRLEKCVVVLKGEVEEVMVVGEVEEMKVEVEVVWGAAKSRGSRETWGLSELGHL